MAALKKRGPIRQFSLQCDSPKSPERRKSLKKQFSEDFIEAPKVQESENGVNIRISVSAKSDKSDRPPPARVAWSENSDRKKDDATIIAKKCSENRRPSAASKLVKQRSLDRDSITYSKQEMADRMKKAWHQREKNKQNLKIFLAHNSTEIRDDDISSDSSCTDPSTGDNQIANSRRPKILLPLQPEVLSGDHNNMKNVFQKHIRKTVRQKSLFTDSCYSPTRLANDRNVERSSTIVVPVVKKTLPRSESIDRTKSLQRQNSLDSTKSRIEVKQETPNNSRPSTAASKREMFQKRTNSAFNVSVKKETNSRPPLTRASSVPLKPENAKPKFVATKRRIKTAKAKVRVGRSAEPNSEDDTSSSSNSNKRSWLQRCVSVSGCEVETMVSLVSPSGSENEDEVVEEKEISPKPEAQPTIKPTLVKQDSQQIEDMKFSLRKTVKSVSFQQSSIHAIRSFSASFPARRGSVATSLFLNNASMAQGAAQTQKIQEKRAPVNAFEDDERVPKRRLVRTKSAPSQRSVDKESPDGLVQENETAISTRLFPADFEGKLDVTATEKATSSPGSADKILDASVPSAESDAATPSRQPNFENAKERQCWDMYCKMNEKGVAVSFDTILRGMLTPTEYRLRRKPSIVPDDNCEIAEN